MRNSLSFSSYGEGELNMNLYQAIFKRKSVRKYSREKLTDMCFKQIKKVIDDIEGLFDIEININVIEEGRKIYKVMNGLIGNIGKISAPHYLVVTSEKKDGYLVNGGYMLEEVVLKLTEMGIGTCWLGGHLERKDVNHLIDIPNEHEVLFMVSFGYPIERNNLYRENIEEIKREDIAELVVNYEKVRGNSKMEELLSAIRVAPSAANSQPWRFKVDDNTLHIFRKEQGFIKKRFLGKINLVDIGISLKHLEIAAHYQRRLVKFNFYKNIEVEKNNLNYIISTDLFEEK